MSAGNPSSPTLFRTLGADDSYFESKARAASKEAEQRWPLFKAVAPAKAEETPVLSPQEKTASWNTPAGGATPPAARPRLSRPGLSQKLATGLRELGQKTRRESTPTPAANTPRPVVAAPPPPEPPAPRMAPARPPLARPVEDTPSAAPAALTPPLLRTPAASSAPRAVARADAAAPRKEKPMPPTPVAAPPLGASLGRLRTASAIAPTAAPALTPVAAPVAALVTARSVDTPAPVAAKPARKKGLFATAFEAPAPLPETPVAPPVAKADATLSGVFARLSGEPPAQAAPRKRGLLFGRTGR